MVFLALLLGCGTSPSSRPPADDSDAGTPDAGKDEPDAGRTPGPWEVPFEWTPTSPIECPPTASASDPTNELVQSLDLEWPVGVPRSFYDALGPPLSSDPARLALFHPLQEDFRLVPCTAGNLARRADAALAGDHPRTALIADAAAAIDLPIQVGGAWPALGDFAPLADAILLVDPSLDRAAVESDAADIPLDVQRAAAHVLLGAIEAAALRDEALASMGDPEDWDDWFALAPAAALPSTSGVLDPDSPRDSGAFVRTPEGAGTLYAGAARIAQAIDEAAFPQASTESFELHVTTRLGAIHIAGGGDDRFDPREDPRLAEPMLLFVDAGGDDEYLVAAGATQSVEQPVAVHVDLGGSDRYGYEEVGSPGDVPGLLPADVEGRYVGDLMFGPFSVSRIPRQGGGVLGYGFLVDLDGGDDTYRSLRESQGFGSVGVGMLWDDGGRDSYEAEAGAQGAGILGIGLLVDVGGDDTYRSFYGSQGFAFVSSYALAYDASGDDSYEMVVDEPVLFWSAQARGRANSSFGQGAASGWRRDDTGTPLAGGIGILRDREGSDRYEGATFVQGSGYWMALGVLADAEGNDTYDGLWYSQAGAAHFALAAFLEGDGDDVYGEGRAATSSCLGLGHDYSVAVFDDDRGNDRYHGPDRSLGTGKCHGVGVFVDELGSDSYEGPDRSMGWATDWQNRVDDCGTSTLAPTYGLFVDADGTDQYVKPDASLLGDDRTWQTDDPADTDALEISGGIDARSSTFAAGSARAQ